MRISDWSSDVCSSDLWAICLTPIAFICAVKRMKFRSCMSTRSGTAKMISPTLAEPDLLLASRMVEARLRMADLLALHLVDVEFEAGGPTDAVGACQIGIEERMRGV